LASHMSAALTLAPTFYVHSHDAPPRLPSFPTRRSSDLGQLPLAPVHPRAHPLGRAERSADREPLDGRLRLSRRHRARAVLSGVRSEEHTSELQSRFELVCRLLLEKKKP